ncbi:helix-turn-helix domain-containing protein [Salmonella enterica subsp. enterica serovar Durham]|nr:helix-turn-helix domain-containing protein [Salmonella enterica subsp. enterica serovar Telelkebir]EEM8331887.1 helix-turn-helix domain-containing protein [Salmonella enterica subsp. enterica serovar Durham]
MNRAERLKMRRLALKLTMREVAEAIGLTIAGVQNLERSEVMPGLDAGIKLARLYRRPVQWILDGEGVSAVAVPIVGTTDSGPDENWNTPDYRPNRGWIPLRNDAISMFALKITNSNCSTRYLPGDVLLLNAEHQPTNGNDVFISISDRSILGRLVRVSDLEVIVDELDNGKRYAIDRSEILDMWEIIAVVNANFVDNTFFE